MVVGFTARAFELDALAATGWRLPLTTKPIESP
jgi:hypothetical protein